MARRSVLLLVAALVALVGTALIVLYVQGIDKRATADQELVSVLVASKTINAGESVSSAMDEGKFEKTEVRRADMVEGALSSSGSISDLVALGNVYPGEQIIPSRFGSLGDSEGLIIPGNKSAVSVELSDPARVAGFVNPGSEVAIFMSGEPVEHGPDGEQTPLPSYTGVLLPRVQVIGVGTTSISSKTTTADGAEVVEEVPRAILTVAVDQKEAEKLIFATRNGEIYFALLTDDSKISANSGVTAQDVIPDAFKGRP